MADSFTVEGWSQLRRSLQKYAPEVKQQFDKDAHAVAATVAAEAKANAGWSKSIPPAISTSVTTKGVGIVVRKKRAPVGPLYERGSGRGGAWRHPVFGNRDVWVSQTPRPYLEPAVRRNLPRLVQQMNDLIVEVARKVGI